MKISGKAERKADDELFTTTKVILTIEKKCSHFQKVCLQDERCVCKSFSMEERVRERLSQP